MFTPTPAVVVVRREPMPWIERQAGLRERYDMTSEQQAQVWDRLAAKDREIVTLRELLREYRMDERSLRLVNGGSGAKAETRTAPTPAA